MSDLTPAAIAEGLALLAKATEGEWHVDQMRARRPEEAECFVTSDKGETLFDSLNRSYKESAIEQRDDGRWYDVAGERDLELCALLHNSAPDLIEAAEERDRLRGEAREARSAIRHALQFLRDPAHHGDGHLDECIKACEAVLKYEPRALEGKLDGD